MKKPAINLIIGLLILLPFYAFSQIISSQEFTIKGKILEQETNNPIPFAHVFIEGTLNGTTSDENGNFILTLKKTTSKPLVASAIGFESKSFKAHNSDREIIIYLKKNIYMLDDIEIKADDLPTKRKMNMFEVYFLGSSDNAENSEILNPDDIELFYDKKSKTLFANSSEPILIKNHSLGYKIIYYLKDFKACKDDIQYTGNYYFEELPNIDGALQKVITKRRKTTYQGSRLHLIRALWNNKLKKEGFTLFYNNYRKVKLDDISADLPTGEKIICFKQGVIINFGRSRYNQVHYGNSNPEEKSYLTQIEGCTKIAEDGYYDPASVMWSGKISERRVADLLPYEYNPEIKR